MRSSGRHLAAIAAALLLGTGASAEDCRKLIQGLDAYEREVKRAIRDEPEDLPKELGRHARALEAGDPARADRIQRKIREGLIALEGIDPPPDLARLHSGMVDYQGAGVAVLDARDAGDVPGRRTAELETWLGLQRLFTDLRAVFVAHGCNQGDVEALDRHYLPELAKHIEAIRSGQDPPDFY